MGKWWRSGSGSGSGSCSVGIAEPRDHDVRQVRRAAAADGGDAAGAAVVDWPMPRPSVQRNAVGDGGEGVPPGAATEKAAAAIVPLTRIGPPADVMLTSVSAAGSASH